jgi:hypothetical protein
MALVWGGAACYNGHRVGDDFSAIGLMAQLGTKKINNAKAWTSDEDEQLRKLIISNVPAFDIAADLVARFSQIEGYKCLSLTRALDVVKCQLALA